MKENRRNIELRSEKVRNIIGQVPPVLLRYGIIIIGVVLILTAVASSFLPYRETLPIEVTVKTVPQLMTVNASLEGQFIAEFSSKTGNVKKNVILGFICHADFLLKVVAPIDGKYNMNVSNQDSIKKGDILFIIIPNNVHLIYGEAMLTEKDIERIGSSNKVILRNLQNQTINGVISKVYPLKTNGRRKVRLSLDYDDTLMLSDKLTGKIILDETSVLKRFLNSFR